VSSCLCGKAFGSIPTVVWEATYDGPVHGEDKLTGLVTDSAGNCWVSGYSYGDTTDYDFATVQISPQGKTAWTRRYGSPLKCEDRSWCLARDSAGNVVTCGGSISDFSIGWDFLLIKYDPDGKRLWLRRFDSPWHSDDKPSALAVGPKNCLYVAGFATRRRPVQGVNAGGSPTRRTDTDIALVKYSASGDTLWARFYEGMGLRDDAAVSLAVDRSGNCYVLGKVVNSHSRTDIVLLKYRPDGTLAWSRDIDGAGHSNDLPAAVLLSNSTIDTRHSALVYVVGSATGKRSSFDYFTACLDTAGTELWRQTYDGAGKVDVAAAACLDSADGIVVTGQSTGTASSFDIATVRYSSTGELVWARRYNGTGGQADRGSCVAIDGRGCVLVGGSSIGATSFPDMVILGYSAAGDSLWTFTHAGTSAGESKPVVILPVPAQSPLVTRQSSFHVAGYDYNADTGFDYLLMLLREE
jgi:hypothetical protein